MGEAPVGEAPVGEAPVGEQGWSLRAEGYGPRSVLSVVQGLIELDLGDRLRIRRIESGGLIESELGLGWGAGGTHCTPYFGSWTKSAVGLPIPFAGGSPTLPDSRHGP